MPIQHVVGGKTDAGQARSHNEDYLDYRQPALGLAQARRGALYVVADGVGGRSAGEVASQLAVQTVLDGYYAAPFDDEEVAANLRQAVQLANIEVYDRAQATPGEGGMATTIVAAVVQDTTLTLAYVGDSRAYLQSQGNIELLTRDHTWVNEQIDTGALTPQEAANHDLRHHILRALGHKEGVEVDVVQHRLQAGDTLLLCTDGLTDVVSDDQIQQALGDYGPQEASEVLVGQANAQGGPDNVSVMVVQLDPSHAQPLARAPIQSDEPQVPARSSRPGAAWAFVAFATGLLIGWMLLGWWLWPVQWQDADYCALRADTREAVAVVLSERHSVDGDLDLPLRVFAASQDLEQVAEVLDQVATRIEPANPIKGAQVRRLAQAVRGEHHRRTNAVEPPTAMPGAQSQRQN